ncbi:septum formation inhibitor Maf [Wenyingzhuangia sp. 2_MG-2023]|uniref:septum formation inhibitor Maf n=1 Tax=Wenyingzhuangia sp. 2_MG-2023 TaxID=3062639 RepID=UPI0026E1D39A|nr:septum formation inhibitor Maf [Wenyingzhuangia sp. 2_MG-2023]MDO6736599.1 septum formation inhibitor Maf [Wenyingzhuangia sp. 2_MG-2023]
MKHIIYLSLLIITSACAQNSVKTEVNQQFKEYWYAGKAEITSYDLEQERYGEIRKGNAVNIFVTEPFSKKYNTKADEQNSENISVLKLNATRKFNTGIYPYSVMTSSFMPVSSPNASLKISTSTQEWCGQEYIELKNDEGVFKINNSSYFQGATFKDKKLDKNIVLENDIWSKIRLTPKALPQGSFKIVPDFVYLRFSHHEVKAYQAEGKIIKGEMTTVYQLKYPALNRTLKITFENTFPYKILEWTDTYKSGWGAKEKVLTTKATLKKSLNIAYWEKNSNSDAYLRKELGLE